MKTITPNIPKTSAKFVLSLLFVLFLLFNIGSVFAQNKEVSYTLDDRDRMVRMETKIDEMNKRFEQRFESIENRFAPLENRMQWQFGTLLSAMFILVGFILWDRRTFLKPFQSKIEEVETNIQTEKAKTDKLLSALRELAKEDNKVAQVLKQFNLM